MRVILLDDHNIVTNIIVADADFANSTGQRWVDGNDYPDANIGQPLPAKRNTLAETQAEVSRLTAENERLQSEMTDLQLAVVELYENGGGGVG